MQPNLFGTFINSTKDIYRSKCKIKKSERSEISNSVMKLSNRKSSTNNTQIKFMRRNNKKQE